VVVAVDAVADEAVSTVLVPFLPPLRAAVVFVVVLAALEAAVPAAAVAAPFPLAAELEFVTGTVLPSRIFWGSRLVMIQYISRSGLIGRELTCKTAVSMVAEITTPLPSIFCVTGLVANPKIVWHPKLGTGPKEVAKRLARKVKRLFVVAGAGDVPP
jgi:hypothetical protein